MYNMIQENRQNGKKGFTLAELLVVVAIIAVLVAISIPIFTSQLDKAKSSTDLANARAAKGAAVTKYLSDEDTDGAVYYYDAKSGVVKDDYTGIEGYGKVKDGTTDNKDKIVKVTITQTSGKDDSSTSTSWVDPKTGK